jgi:hypothetical protein
MSGLIIEGPAALGESAITNTALLDSAIMAAAVGRTDDTAVRYDPRFYNFVIQLDSVGAATGLTIEGMGPSGTYDTLFSGVTANQIKTITGVYTQLRLTWTGGTPDGSGVASFWATPKFNGLL